MRVVALVALLVIFACGKSDDKSNYNIEGCTTTPAATGKSVYYAGTKSEYNKFKSGTDYVGKVLSVLADGAVEIDWTSFKSVEYESSVKFEAVCTPALVGKRAYYAGTKSEYNKFKPGTDYVGNILAVFNDGYVYVVWDAGFSTVETKSSLKIEK